MRHRVVVEPAGRAIGRATVAAVGLGIALGLLSVLCINPAGVLRLLVG